jgi:hypothetical protein
MLDTTGSFGNANHSVTVSTSGAVGSTPVDCPAEPPSPYAVCRLPEDGACTYTIDCQSGPVELTFTCSEDAFGWVVAAKDCDYEYDSCPGTELYCVGQWWMPEGTNPPSPCPNPPPTEFSPCTTGAFGGVHQHCGYPCEDDASSGWTIATCSGDFAEGVWEYDSACAP